MPTRRSSLWMLSCPVGAWDERSQLQSHHADLRVHAARRQRPTASRCASVAVAYTRHAHLQLQRARSRHSGVRGCRLKSRVERNATTTRCIRSAVFGDRPCLRNVWSRRFRQPTCGKTSSCAQCTNCMEQINPRAVTSATHEARCRPNRPASLGELAQLVNSASPIYRCPSQ
jgi:hypothetical protein